MKQDCEHEAHYRRNKEYCDDARKKLADGYFVLLLSDFVERVVDLVTKWFWFTLAFTVGVTFLYRVMDEGLVKYKRSKSKRFSSSKA